jgi:hypothetical protein
MKLARSPFNLQRQPQYQLHTAVNPQDESSDNSDWNFAHCFLVAIAEITNAIEGAHAR